MEMQRIVKGLFVNFTEFYLNFDTSDDLISGQSGKRIHRIKLMIKLCKNSLQDLEICEKRVDEGCQSCYLVQI